MNRKRSLKYAAVILLAAVLYLVAAAVTDFDFRAGLRSFPEAGAWMAQRLVPDAKALERLPKIIDKLIETALLSVAVTVTAGICAFLFSLLGSRITGFHGSVSQLVRTVAAFFRNVPDVVWAMVLMFSFGQNILTGYFALFFTTFGLLTRSFIETIDEVSSSCVEALRASGANFMQIVVQGIIPSAVTGIITWILYMIETNIRSSTLIGILTATGIGYLFDMYYKRLEFGSAGLVVLSIVVLVIVIETISNQLKKVIRSKSNKPIGFLVAALLLITVYAFCTFDYKEIQLADALGATLHNIKTVFLEPRLTRDTVPGMLYQLFVTFCLGILATIFGAVLAFFCSLLCAGNISSPVAGTVIKGVIAIIRAVPTVLWVLIFAVSAGLGSVAAVIGLTFHSFAYLTKMYAEAIEEMDDGVIEALRATGANFWQIVFQAVVPSTITYLVAWTFMRFEINFTNAVAMGAAAGAGGIGFHLFMAGNFYFDLHEMGFLTYVVVLAVVVLEAVSTRIKEKVK